jgi:hypothetical protein
LSLAGVSEFFPIIFLMNTRRFVPLLLTALLLPVAVFAAEKLTVVASHDLDIARPSEMISVPWAEVTKALPDALIHQLAVKDSAGRTLPYQVTNTRPLDPNGSYGELLFQHDFAAGQKSATFTVEKLGAVAPPFPSKVFARYVPERLDDFAWENDKVAHRTYGPALEAPAQPGVRKEVLVANGLDIWCKRVSYPIVDRWYNKGHNHYHKDQGEGMDMYQVGPTRGCGGTGVWDGQKLHVGRNYKTWKVLANGPIRAIFELGYAPYDANGVEVTEVRRFTVDAGHNLDQIESTLTFTGGKDITLAIGVNKNSGDRNQDSKAEVTKNDAAWLAQWEVQNTNGSIGTAIVVERGAFTGFAEDERNQLVLAKATSGQPVRFYAGAGWSKAGEFTTKDAWSKYVATSAARANSPVKVELSASK